MSKAKTPVSPRTGLKHYVPSGWYAYAGTTQPKGELQVSQKVKDKLKKAYPNVHISTKGEGIHLHTFIDALPDGYITLGDLHRATQDSLSTIVSPIGTGPFRAVMGSLMAAGCVYDGKGRPPIDGVERVNLLDDCDLEDTAEATIEETTPAEATTAEATTETSKRKRKQ